MHTALFGLGKMGMNHLRILSSQKKLVLKYLYDQNFAKAKELSNSMGLEAHQDIDHILSKIENLIIVTPASTHHDIFQKAANYPNIKNIFIEKPAGISLSEKINMLNTAKSNIKIQVGFIERFNPVVNKISELLSTNSVLSIDLSRTDRLSARINDTDIVHDLMVHDIDILLSLFPDIVLAHKFLIKENDIVNFASATFTTPDQSAIFRIIASRLTEKKIREITVTAKDFYCIGNLANRDLKIFRQTTYSQEKDYKILSQQEEIELSFEEPLLREIDSFASLCSGEISIEQVPNLNSSVKVQEIVDQILKVA